MPIEEPKPTSLRLPADLKAKLVELADADGRSLSNYILRVLQGHVDALGRRGGKR